jgi:hypothetical protein
MSDENNSGETRRRFKNSAPLDIRFHFQEDWNEIATPHLGYNPNTTQKALGFNLSEYRTAG